MLTGLELTFMGVTRCNSGLFSTPGFVVSPVGKRERGEERKKKKGRREKGNRKGRKERRKEEGIKKRKKEEGIQGKGGKKKKKKFFCWL